MGMIAILTPSRSRPRQFAEMVEATLSSAEGDVWIYCGVDHDDPALGRYQALAGDRVTVLGGWRQQLAGWTNRLATMALAGAPTILASFGDDHRPRTQGWDTRVTEAMADLESGLVYTRDGLQDERLPTAPFWSADIIRELGWFYPPVLKHMFADDYWLRLGRDLGRVTYLDDVLIEHLHPSAGKGEMDAVYRENDTHYETDRAAFDAFIRDEHPAILERLRCVF